MASTTTVAKATVITLFVVIFVLAVWWEINDAKRILRHRAAFDETDLDRQRKAYAFFGCHMYQNRVTWRGAYIVAAIAILGLLYVLYAFGYDPSLNMLILLFGVIFVVSYIYGSFNGYHLHRPMCGKVNPHLTMTGADSAESDADKVDVSISFTSVTTVDELLE